jgi:hypothetical protein
MIRGLGVPGGDGDEQLASRNGAILAVIVESLTEATAGYRSHQAQGY